MKRKYSIGLMGLLLAGPASAQGLYYVGGEAKESIPLKWVVGSSVIYDDNVSPGFGSKESSFAVSPYLGVSFVTITPQTTWDVYARLGLIYYFDAPPGVDDVSPESRAGFSLTHRFNERLRFSSRNFMAYELEPDYSYGYASSRQSQSYFYWQTDNSVGYRWTERLATYTGFSLSGANYDEANNDRFTWTLYNQFRYQLAPQTVLTADYRYSETIGNGLSSDATDQYILVGAEHRFSPNTIGIIRGGIQLHDVDAGSSAQSPYLELALNSQVNQQFSVRAFTRYGIENYDTVRSVPAVGLAEFSDRSTLRFGLSAEYAISPVLSLFGGVDYIPSDYQDGKAVGAIKSPVGDYSEDIVNTYVGLSMKINDFLTGSLTYNYSHQDSDFAGQTYNRNRVSVGVSSEF
jgi:hypothetical protein